MNEATDTLLICGSFFGYAREIRLQLERGGRSVALFEDRPATDSLTKALIRLAPSLMRPMADAYFDAISAQLRNCPVKDVLVVKGEALSQAAIRRMRAALPNARFTLYFWDSYRNMPPDSYDKVALFDRALTFDPRDAEADSRLTYRPLFFLDEYAALRDEEPDIDVLFFGTMHGDRYAVLQRLQRALPAQLRFEKVLYFQAHWLFWMRKLSDPTYWLAAQRNFIFKPMSKAGIQALIARARIVVDIERPVQSGYTMRTLEILGAARKLITTNREIANADFFNPANIAIVDRDAPVVPADFLSRQYEPPPSALLRRYSLTGWLGDVLPTEK